jgi:hypothetical protein
VAPSDRFIVSKTDRTVIRKCPFCYAQLEDFTGKDVNFIVHLGNPIVPHRTKQEWADYVTRMNHA